MMLSRLRPLLFVAFALGLLVPRTARAIEYEIFVDVDTEDEIYDLYVTGQIDEDTLNTLIELRRRGVDLNEATREQLYALPNLTYDDVDAILAYRAEVGAIHAPADLVAAGVLSDQKLGAILTFISASDREAKLTATHGWVRYMTAWSQKDSTVPPMMLQARITTLRQLTVGMTGFVTRQRPGDAVWDPTREKLVAPELGPRVPVPKFFAEWDGDRFAAIVGTYQIGFGQRLTIDTTSRYTPNGFFIDDTARVQQDLGRKCRESSGELPETPCPAGADDPREYTTKDFYWRQGLRGVAIGAKQLSLPVGWMQLYGFGSWQARQLYQYNIVDRNTCDDPRDPTCTSPQLLVEHPGQDRFDPTSAHIYATLPNMYDELLGGGNWSWFYDRRTHVGVTGYGATVKWRPEGADLDFKDSATTPFGGPWGAVGVDMAWGRRWSDLGIEVARSFDSVKSSLGPGADEGGGGFAAIARQTSTFGSHELELSARYYDSNYANPYAGPISQLDKYQGNLARNEAGGRIRYGGRVAKQLDVRGLLDVWVQPTNPFPKMQARLRGDWDVNKWFRPGLWLDYRNSDLRPDRKDGCFNDNADLDADVELNYDENGNIIYPSGCTAEYGKVTARFGFHPLDNKLSIIAQYQHKIVDDTSIDTRLRQDSQAMLTIRVKPVAGLNLAGRIKYLYEDIQDNTRYEQSVWTYVDVPNCIKRLFSIRLRYDTYVWLDQRSSTANRIPNPEHRLRLELEARF